MVSQLAQTGLDPASLAIRTGLDFRLGLACWSGVAAWDAAPGAGHKLLVGGLFGANVVFHMFWSPLFFHLRRPDWAFLEVLFLWASVVALIAALAPFSPLSSWLLVPDFLWASFAA